MARHKYEDAVEVLEMALEVEGLDDEELADVLYHLGTCYERVSAVDDEFRKAWKRTLRGGAGAGGNVGDMAVEIGEETEG